MDIIVQKFGGTSVATQQRREMAANKIEKAIKAGIKPVVVVSAIGRKGDPYATDTLLSLINNENVSIEKKDIDLLLSCGEIISAVVMAETIKKRGYNVSVLTGGQAGIITNESFGSAEIKRIDTKKILKLLQNNIIPVIAGFQGATANGDITTLGRGGSDITGAAIGDALKALAIEIYTDVDGIMTADPNIVPDASIIEKISYNEVFELADQGAKVIHPKAVEYAMRGNISLIIKNTMKDTKGTTISTLYEEMERPIAGITYMPNRTQFIVKFDTENKFDNIFNYLAECGISIDLINVFPEFKAFTVCSIFDSKVEEIFKNHNITNYKMTSKCCKIAVVGNGMKGIPGIMANILKTLFSNNIELLQTADSHSTIWCLVKDEDVVRTINLLHKSFNL